MIKYVKFLPYFILFIVIMLFFIRLNAPMNLKDNNEERIIAYIFDIIHNGNWITQYNAYDEIITKPPLYSWISAIVALPFKELNRFCLYFPGFLATLLIALAIFFSGKKYFGDFAALFSSLIYIMSSVSANQVLSTRYDALFSLFIFLGAMSAFNSWKTEKGWIFFWLYMIGATLTKGPLGIILASGGLFAALWEYFEKSYAPIKGNHLKGIIFYFIIAGGWFLFAYLKEGQKLIDVMIFSELVEQTLRDKRHFPLEKFYMPAIYFLTSFVPWSIFSCIGFWKILKHPSKDISLRRFERFIFCGFFTGLLIFSFSAHQRSRLIYPLIPFGALIAGNALAKLLSNVNPKKIRMWITFVISAFFIIVFLSDNLPIGPHYESVKETKDMQSIAEAIPHEQGKQFPLIFIDEPFPIQFFLNTFIKTVPMERVLKFLKSDYKVFIVLSDKVPFFDISKDPSLKLYELIRCPPKNDNYMRILSNHPRLERTASMAMCIGPLDICMNGLILNYASEKKIVLSEDKVPASLNIQNTLNSPYSLTIIFKSRAKDKIIEKIFKPFESFTENFTV